MMPRFATEAERLRHHRRCFEFALEHGLTPKDAEDELAKIRSRERDRAAMERIEARQSLPLRAPEPFEHWQAPWMRRD